MKIPSIWRWREFMVSVYIHLTRKGFVFTEFCPVFPQLPTLAILSYLAFLYYIFLNLCDLSVLLTCSIFY